MEAVAILLYVLYYPLTLFENMMVGRPFIGTRPLWFNGENQVSFQILVRVVALVSVALIWWNFSFIQAIAAFAGCIAFSRVTFRFFYRKSLLVTDLAMERVIAEEIDCKSSNPRHVSIKAMKLANSSIHRIVKDEY